MDKSYELLPWTFMAVTFLVEYCMLPFYGRNESFLPKLFYKIKLLQECVLEMHLYRRICDFVLWVNCRFFHRSSLLMDECLRDIRHWLFENPDNRIAPLRFVSFKMCQSIYSLYLDRTSVTRKWRKSLTINLYNLSQRSATRCISEVPWKKCK